MCLLSTRELLIFIGPTEAVTFIPLSPSHADSAHLSDVESSGMAEPPTTPTVCIITETAPWISTRSA